MVSLYPACVIVLCARDNKHCCANQLATVSSVSVSGANQCVVVGTSVGDLIDTVVSSSCLTNQQHTCAGISSGECTSVNCQRCKGACQSNVCHSDNLYSVLPCQAGNSIVNISLVGSIATFGRSSQTSDLVGTHVQGASHCVARDIDVCVINQCCDVSGCNSSAACHTAITVNSYLQECTRVSLANFCQVNCWAGSNAIAVGNNDTCCSSGNFTCSPCLVCGTNSKAVCSQIFNSG